MWKLLKFAGHLLKALFWIALLLICCVVILLYIFENGLPAAAVNKISEKLSSEDVITKIDRITFSPASGLHLYNISAVPRKIASESFGTVDDLIVTLSLSPFIDHSSRIRSVTIRGADMPRHPRRIFRKLAAMQKEKKPDKPRKKIPLLEPFKLTVEDSNIIGMRAKSATAMASLDDPYINFSDIKVIWPDTSRTVELMARVSVNLETELLEGHAKGEAYPEHLTDFLAELGARTVIREINRFSEIEDPIKAECDFNVDLKTSDFTVGVGLDVKSCAYRDVPLTYAKGSIKAWGTNNLTWVELSDLAAANSTGDISGELFYDDESSMIKVKAASAMAHNDVLTIIDILTHGELNPLKPKLPPSVTANGMVDISTNTPARHDLHGTIRIGEAEIFGLNVKECTSTYHVKGDNALLNDVNGTTPSGGKVTGHADFAIPSESDSPPSITAEVKFDRIDLTDLARVFSITNSRGGDCFGVMQLSGVLGTNQLHTLNGEGSFRLENSRVIRLKLFAGLTDYVSRNIPGVSSVVDQSDCSLSFTIEDGILSSKDFLIEGSVFSIQGKGQYDMVKDNLDFTVHVALFRQKSFAGRISRIVTFPFKKLLLEFKVFGSVDDPNWSYVNILEKITDQLPEM